MNDTDARILAFVRAYIDEHGWAPTYAEIQAGAEIPSKETVHRHLRALAADGKLRVGSGYRKIALPRT